MSGFDDYLPTIWGVGLLVVVTSALLLAYRVPHSWAPALAILRGGLQLAAISLILSGVIENPWLVGCALVVMFLVATVTATRRLGWTGAHFAMLCSAMGAGIVVTLGIVFLSGALEPSARYLLAIGGIVVGNAMGTATLTGRYFTASASSRWDEIEGWLALGAKPRQATFSLTRGAVHSALVPAVDQTKTTGLVTLPGAFVGAIFGGISPLEAGRFQIVVLAAVLATGAITAVVTACWLAPVQQRPAVVD
jgi:putative ABC transport system permease protein